MVRAYYQNCYCAKSVLSRNLNALDYIVGFLAMATIFSSIFIARTVKPVDAPVAEVVAL